MAHFKYVLFEAAVYNSAGSKLRDAIEKYNSMNEEGYKTLQSLNAYMSTRDPNLESKLDKAIGYLKNIQAVYTEMEGVIDKYMADEMKNTPEIADTIKRDCENTKKTIAELKAKDKDLLDMYSRQKENMKNSGKSQTFFLGVGKKMVELFKSHKSASPKISALGSKLSA